ncbi:MAG: alpha-E domain-containing protein [Humibacter sp.]
MLSRIAESLFWIGRYLERADGTARILDAHLQLLLEDPWTQEDEACRSLLAVMGVEGSAADAPSPTDAEPMSAVGRADVLRLLAVDRQQPASIAFSLWSARENARRAREIVSTELWECLNTTTAGIPRQVRPDKVHTYFHWVRDRVSLAVGINESLMARDEAWHFYRLGRNLERADMTARLLATRSLTQASGVSWTTILRSCSAYEAYLRTYRGVASSRNAAEFLLLDRLFPRSIMYSLSHAALAVRDLEPATARVGVSDRAALLLGQVISGLEYRLIGDIVDDLPANMAAVQRATSNTSEAVRARYFPTNALPIWVGEMS